MFFSMSWSVEEGEEQNSVIGMVVVKRTAYVSWDSTFFVGNIRQIEANSELQVRFSISKGIINTFKVNCTYWQLVHL